MDDTTTSATAASASAMPAVFVGHGTPMNTLEHNRFTDAWKRLGNKIGRPRAILAISAHWYINGSAVTAMEHPRVIHDFYGFPPQLFAFDYPAPGDPDLAAKVVELAEPVRVALDADSWGLDHGTWSVLAHLVPEADVPVVQLSIDASKSIDYHIDLGARLTPLLNDGVLILASGNIVHNLRRMERGNVDGGFDWAERFDEATSILLHEEPSALARLTEHPDFASSVPTPDLFLPLAYFAGISAALAEQPGTLVEGCTMGSLSMTSHTVETRG